MGRVADKGQKDAMAAYMRAEEHKYGKVDAREERKERNAEARKRRAAEAKKNKQREERLRLEQAKLNELKAIEAQSAINAAPAIIVDPLPISLHPAMQEALNDMGRGWIPVRSKQLMGQRGGMLRFNPEGPHKAYILRVNDALINDRPCWEVTAKARQQFWSTTCAVVNYCLAKHLDGIGGLVAAHEDRAATTLWEMYRNIRDNDPDLPRNKEMVDEDGKKKRQKDSAGELMLPNKSRVVVDLAKNTLGKSGAYHFAQLSEADFYEGVGVNLSVMWSDFLTTMPDTGFSVLQVESTRDPVSGGWLQHMYEQAMSRKGRFRPNFVPWFTSKGKKFQFPDEDERKHTVESITPYEKRVMTAGATLEQIAWARIDLTDSGGDRALWAAQNPAFIEEVFSASRMCAFDTTKLDGLAKTSITPARWRYEVDLDRKNLSPIITDGGADARLLVWRHPVGGHQYFIGADSASGIASADEEHSEAACVVLDATTKEVVARWSGYEQPIDFASIIAALGYHYNTAMLVPELNNHGNSTVDHLAHVLEYPIDRIFHERSETTEIEERRNRLGWVTNQASKIRMVSNGRFVINNGTILLNDVKIIEQARSFVQVKDGVYQKARKSDKDDVLISFMLAVSEAMHYHDFGVKSEASARAALRLTINKDDDFEDDREPASMNRHRYGRRARHG